MNTYAIAMFVTAAFSTALALYVWRQRPAPGATPLALLMLALAEWSGGYAFELSSPGLPAKLWWTSVNFIGIVWVGMLFMVFALDYTRRTRWLTRRHLVLLSVVPIVTLAMAWTNDYHGLIRSAAGLDLEGPIPMLDPTYNTGFWILWLYTFGTMATGSALLLHKARTSPGLYRGQSTALLLGALVPWAGNALYLSGLSPFHKLDITPFSFAVAGAALTWGFFRYRLFDIVPVARDTVIENMNEGVIVLDAQARLVDLNPAAQRIIGLAAGEAIGRPAGQVLSAWSGLAGHYGQPVEAQLQVALGEREAQRYLDLSVSPLYERHGIFSGQLIVCRDVTERERLQAAVLASEAKYRTVVERGSDGIIIIQDDLVRYSNPQMSGLSGYLLEEILNTPFENFVVPEARYQVRERHRRRLKGESAVIRYELGLLHKEGRRIEAEVSVGVIEYGGRPAVLAMVRDITERKRAEAELQKYQAELAASYEREQERRRLSDTLREVATIVSSSLDPQKVLDLVLKQLEKVVTYHRANVMVLSGDDLSIVAERDEMGGLVAWDIFPLSKYPLNEHVIQSRQPLLLADVQGDERWNVKGTMGSIRSYISAPLLALNRPVGILAVGRRDQTPYTEEDAQTVFAFASQVAMAIENARWVERERERLQHELETARQIQISLLPDVVPHVAGLDIAAASQPARQVGGDFYNYFNFGERQLGIAVGDVSGKGMQAALMMSLSFGLLTTEVRRKPSPAALLAAMDSELRPHAVRSKLNTALTYVLLEAGDSGWNLAVSNAGLIAPLIRRCNGKVEWWDVGGLPLGTNPIGTGAAGMGEPTQIYKEVHQVLYPGDVLILSSDGIVEAMDKSRQLYGFERLTACVAKAPLSNAQNILDHILARVRAFAGEEGMHDDVTLIVVAVNGETRL